MLLKLSKHLFSERVGDLRVDARVLDIAVSQVVSNVLDAASDFKEMYRNGVSQGVDRTASNTSQAAVVSKEILHLPFLQCSFLASEEVRAYVSSHPHVGAEEFCRVSP
jgi:hypothetical protein